jgi:hypothetical protein
MHKTGTKEDEAGKKLRSYKVRNRAEGQSIGPMTFGPTCLIVCPTTLMDNVSESRHCLRQLLILLYDNIKVGTRIRNGELRMVKHRITLRDRFRSQWGYFECGRLDNRADEKRVLNRYKQGFFDIGKWGSCPLKCPVLITNSSLRCSPHLACNSTCCQRGNRRFALLVRIIKKTYRDHYHLTSVLPYSVVIIDEAHALKNPKSYLSIAAKGLNADSRFALTGEDGRYRPTDTKCSQLALQQAHSCRTATWRCGLSLTLCVTLTYLRLQSMTY